ncbi:MAG: hypothetical protein RBR41_14370 [Desulfovibrio sp.]|uniref:hypothetical protein n=1 Tax=Desulfovibrio sp. TaxID=885 RepID=UPI002A360A54|nr:hypothetical protein [Desulfovibrio sp.]MDY0260835.1 hypothetical protein [Desulfovibrio sp.]
MNPQEIQTLISAMQTIAAVLSGLGVPGLVALALAAPAMVLVTVLVLDHIRNTRMAMMQQEFRTDTTRILDAYRNNTSKILEAYRVDTQSVCKELGKEHAEAVRFYNDNVELVKDYERMADALQTLVINNTRAVERLITIVEARTK